MLTVDALKELYVKMGGSLTDTYDGIAGGVPVSEYALIPDMIEAVTQKASSGGGGGEGGDGNPVFPITLLKQLTPATFTDNGITYYCLGVRTEQQLVKGGMDDITISDLHSQIGSMAGYNMSARFLTDTFAVHTGVTTWYNDDALLAAVKVEAKTAFELWEGVSAAILAAEPESGHDSRIAAANSVLSYYLKTNDFGQYLQNDLGNYITPYISGLIELKGTVGEGQTIADVTTIVPTEAGKTFGYAYNAAIADNGRGVNVCVKFVDTNGDIIYGAVTTPLFVSVDNGTYTATFMFHDGTSVKKAVSTGTSSESLSFTVS